MSLLRALVLPSYMLLGITVSWLSFRAFLRGRRGVDLPPGPPTLPFLGNLTVFPKKWPHYKFTEWSKQYGDIFSLKVLHLDVIVLNSPSAVKELIDRRGASTSNRPSSIIADMITPHSMNIGTARVANETWRIMRKAAMAMLTGSHVDRFKPVQHAEAAQLMWDMSRRPEDFYQDISRFTTSFFLAMIYGHRAPRSSTPEARIFTQVQLDFMHVLEIGKLPPVDLFPILQCVPERFSAWKQKVMAVRRTQESLFGGLLSLVKARVACGEHNGSFMEEAYARRTEWGLSDEMLMNLGGTLLEGSDTSSAILQVMVLCLVAFPEAQKRAQEEIDLVIGQERCPTFADIDKLPYLRALIEETYRFRPVGALAIPHAMVKDEWVDGMLFPKDAALFINLWAIFHDPRYFDEPEKFKPERFLENPYGVRADVIDDPGRRENLMFGGGRRVCPGIKVGRAGIEINAMNFIWAFNFSPALDPITGALVPPDLWAFTEVDAFLRFDFPRC